MTKPFNIRIGRVRAVGCDRYVSFHCLSNGAFVAGVIENGGLPAATIFHLVKTELPTHGPICYTFQRAA